jgi:catechol 2,3-dioxygenase-like lactoylglutathione lyase family enzyme
MVQSSIGHMQFNVQPENLAYYRDLLSFLGWQVLYDVEGMVGMGGPGSSSLWFAGQCKEVANDYDGPGLNHLGLSVPAQADVDATVDHLRNQGVTLLFDTPRHRPEFSGGEDQTYYQVMFETPDCILIEVVYTGTKA